MQFKRPLLIMEKRCSGIQCWQKYNCERYMQRHERHWSTPHMQGAYMTCGIFFAGGLEMLSWFAPERLREYYTFQCKHLIPVSGLKNVENE